MLVRVKTSSFSYGGFYASGSKGRCRNMATSQSDSKDSPKLLIYKKEFCNECKQKLLIFYKYAKKSRTYRRFFFLSSY